MTDSSKVGRKQDGTFQKGFTGNPHGRPKKGNSIAEILISIGDEMITNKSTGEQIEKRKAMLQTIYAAALQGDLAAARWIADRTEGTPIQTIRTQEIEKDELIEI